MERYPVTEVEMKRYAVLQNASSGLITLKAASELLGSSYRQTLRLKKRFVSQGWEGLLRKAPPHPPHRRVDQELEEEIVKLRRTLYPDFNILHFREKLKEHHGITLSSETLRKLLIKRELHLPKTKKRTHRRRRRMPRAGLLQASVDP